MAVLPTADSLQPAASGRSGRDIAPGPTDSIGPALQQLGQAGEGLSMAFHRQAEAASAIEQANATAGYQIESIKTDHAFTEQNDPNYQTYGARSAAALSDARDRFAAGISDPNKRAEWLAQTSVDVARSSAIIDDRGLAVGRGVNVANLNTTLDNLGTAYVSTNDPAKKDAAAKAANDAITANEANLGAAETARMRTATAQRFAKLQLEADASADPATVLAKLGDTSDAGAFIKGKEGFKTGAYWDVNHWRVGYGSDTYTTPDGASHAVTKDTIVSKDDANRDLARRIGSFQSDIVSAVGADKWNGLSGAAKTALTSVAYNYGALPNSVVDAVKTGDAGAIASAVSALSSNPARRSEEAAIIRTGNSPLDPHAAMLSPEDVIGLRAKAQSELNAQTAAGHAQATALAASTEGTYARGIAEGVVTDPNTFRSDPNISDAQKAVLDNAYAAHNAEQLKTTAALGAVASGQRMTPYSADDRKTSDLAYTKMGGSTGLVEGDKAAADKFRYITGQTGVPPPSGLATLLGAMTGPDSQKAANAYGIVSDLYKQNPRIFDGSADAEKFTAAAETYQHLTQDRGMSAADATQKMQNAYNPETIKAEAVLKPAADDFVKKLDPTKIAYKVGTTFFSGPAQGATPTQVGAFAADVAEIGREQFMKANGDATTAEQGTIAAIKGLYTVSNSGGSPALMRQAPELRYPQIDGGYDYIHREAIDFAAKATGLAPPAGNQFKAHNQQAGLAGVSLIATRQTAADFSARAQSPHYDVLTWKWDHGQKIIGDVLHDFSIPPSRLAELQKPASAAAVEDHAIQQRAIDMRANYQPDWLPSAGGGTP